jgi:PIN domain nuclease of toxin-antitoxin system
MILLDTHVLIWWIASDPGLSKKASGLIKHELAEGEILVSSISAWEIAMLVERDRLLLGMDVAAWLALVTQIPRLRFVPVDMQIALDSVTLPGGFHKDPADRMIVATARKLGIALITKDEKIRAYRHVKTQW